MNHYINKVCASMLLVSLTSTILTGWLIREKDGYVALWDDSAGCWHSVTDVPVSSLPAADRQSIADGIPAESREAAASMLEDYCS